MSNFTYLDRNGTFQLAMPENYSYLYFPLASEKGLKSSITPNLGGDSKTAQESFLLEPVSSENLHNNRSTRNFWCLVEGERPWSMTGASADAEAARFTEEQEKSSVTAGFLWHKLTRENETIGLKAEITSFVPWDDAVEVTLVEITNTGEKERSLEMMAAVPIYGRSADNIRDHRNVTSMLHRIQVLEDGVCVYPTMSFDERGHRINHTRYFVCGSTGDGATPVAFYPSVDSYLGEGGSFTKPGAVYREDIKKDFCVPGDRINGREAVGAFRFEPQVLAAGETACYIVWMGITEEEEDLSFISEKYHSKEQAILALEKTKEWWQERANVDFHAGDEAYDNFLKWVSFQPFLRAIYGCSFLPHHDYGRGGRGWRDLWQDCLSLLIMDPREVRNLLVNNIAGVRMDGSNATIIGSRPGEFVADRNGIARVWMDHGVWPFKTILFYIHQTGDLGVLLENAMYFKDAQAARGNRTDDEWNMEQGTWQKDRAGELYQGSMLEHILLEHLTSYYERGEHDMMRLRGADWNDALDMANERGESVAFTAAYAGNLKEMATLLLDMKEKLGITTVSLAKEMMVLLRGKKEENPLAEYLDAVKHVVSGEKEEVLLEEVAALLEEKASELMEVIRATQWIRESDDCGWYNSYYDNSGRAVEKADGDKTRMMLTGQVFTIMSHTADEEHTRQIAAAAKRHLYRKEIGGYRLNTDFGEVKTDLGRMFGFAYGEKENGAVFSHMTVMYAYALYSRGFVKEGYEALQTLAEASLHFETSRIYPGIPEYFNADGRGVYHYLTGAASWYLMTMVTMVFGVRGEYGDLRIDPKLTLAQFDEKGEASLGLVFAGRKLHITYQNTGRVKEGDYRVKSATLNGEEIAADGGNLIMKREQLTGLDPQKQHEILVVLE
ncbi:Glycosyltransferase family 36 [Lachnospiraceae bacterium C10]|nr:Glycosyltransferase family 36 [Lachnospiraceae bacterium C10]